MGDAQERGRIAEQQAKRAELDAQREAVRDRNRENVAKMLRQARGVEEPVARKAEEKAVKAEAKADAAKEAAAVQAQKAAPDDALSQQLAERVAKTEREALEARTHAAQVKAEADKRVAAAEAKVRKFEQNPVKYFEETSQSLDEWQARLMNGGEETEEQKFRRELLAETKAAKEAVAEMRREQEAARAAAVRAQSVQTLREPLQSDFPLVSAMIGPEKVLEHLQQVASANPGQSMDYAAELSRLEEDLYKQHTAVLQNPHVARKYSDSVKAPKAEAAEVSSPRTMTNRLTSSTSAGSSDWVRPGSREDLLRKRARVTELLAARQG